jgi:leucine dehydrogenase
VRLGERSGLPTMVAVHSTARGPALGGVRLWVYDSIDSAMADALRLARAMTFKAAAAGLPMGGGKGVIMLPSHDALARRGMRTAVLRDFGETVGALGGSYLTAEDVGITTRDMQVVAKVTPHVTGLPRAQGGSGDPSPWTALGVEIAMRVAVQRRLGATGLAGLRIVVAGLGHVGARLAAACAEAGADLVVSDIDTRKQALADRLGARWVDPDAALSVAADVFAPCALGGVLSHATVGRLGAPVVVGAANNQLATEDVAEDLAARDVLWVPDFVANAAGIINIAVELRPEGYDARQARRDVHRIGDTVRLLLDEAEAASITPLEAAMRLAHQRVAEAGKSASQPSLATSTAACAPQA